MASLVKAARRQHGGGPHGSTFTITAIPEPSTYVLLAMAAASCGAHLLRRRKRGKVS